MGIIDRYIIRKYLGTFGFILLLLSVVVLIIDVQAKKPRIQDNGFELSHFLINYYPFWIIYLVMTFMSILVFISVIFFTSRMANNTEIVAIISSGASFHRFAKPYLITSLFIATASLLINHFVLPWANVKKMNWKCTLTARPTERKLLEVRRFLPKSIRMNLFSSTVTTKKKKGVRGLLIKNLIKTKNSLTKS